ncbi:MAG: peptide chain release factor 3 [Candidatus Limnocylindria bacterium]
MTFPTAAPRHPADPSAVAPRRTFAIISHPDAGKTTLTEKLLLFGGAVEEAGSVRARRQAKSTVSDWMEMERRRGISVSSTVLRFAHGGVQYNLVDTPGHADFSEDTYRALWAVDAALMVLDAGKGLEPQTLKLFQVCRMRGLPIVTFINKCDRPMLAPLGLLDEIEREIGVHPAPMNWPIGTHGKLHGLLDIAGDAVIQTDATVHGATIGEGHRTPADAWDPGAATAEWHDAREEASLVAAAIDPADVHAERVTPVFFGSALTNVGLSLLLDAFPAFSVPPTPRTTEDGTDVALDGQFSAQVFKVQTNTDPRHRDRVAFMRVNSGRFERGMTAVNGRSGRRLSLAYSSELFGQDRQTIDEAFPGDVIGVVNASGVQVGDTLCEDGSLRYPPIPEFLPERFAQLRSVDSSRYKQFRNGMQQLEEEGVIRVLRRPDGMGEPIIGVVGQLQLEVAEERLTNEFGCRVERSEVSYDACRAIDPEDEPKIPDWRSLEVVHDGMGRRLVLATSTYVFDRLDREVPGLRWLEPGAGLGAG